MSTVLPTGNTVRRPIIATRTVTRTVARVVAELGPLVVVVPVIFALCVINLRQGHDWGDDFSLYIRQAKAIAQWNVRDVVDSNAYTVDNSSWHTFSPDMYPWGFPLLLTPLYAFWGINFHVFKLLGCALFALFLVFYGRLVMRRLGELGGLLLVLLVGLSVAYVGWTDTVLSDLPYTCFVALTLWLADRARRAGILAGASTALLVGVGVACAYTASIRREGLALFAAVAGLQLAAWWSHRLATPRAERARPWVGVPWKRLALPHVTGLAVLGVFQLLFPALLADRYPGTGLHQVKPNLIWFRDILAENLGLKDAGTPGLTFAGSESFGKWMLGLFVAAAAVGMAVRSVKAWREDIAILVYLLLASYVIATLPFHEGRYLFSITPLLAYFAYQGVAAAVRLAVARLGSERHAILPPLLAGTFVGVLALSNATDLWHRTDFRLEYGAYTVWGPADPAAEEMFAAVHDLVPDDDVIAFFRARSMNLFGERQAVQITSLAHLLERTDWYAMEKNSSYSQYLLTDEEAAANRITLEWENERFIIWKMP